MLKDLRKQLKKSSKSGNFWNNIIITAIAIFGVWGIPVPADVVPELISAIEAKDIFGIITIIVSIGNILFHFFKDKTIDTLVISEDNLPTAAVK